MYVTHDQVEAMTLGDRVAVLKDGVLQQVAAPRELYDRPVNMFVAGFIGSPAMNLFPGVVFGREVMMGVRPADMWMGVGPSAAASDKRNGSAGRGVGVGTVCAYSGGGRCDAGGAGEAVAAGGV